MAKDKVMWEPVLTESFDKDLKGSYDKMEKAFSAYESAKEEFYGKAKMQISKDKKIPDGKAVAFNYTGKMLMIAFIEPKRASARTGFSFGNP